MRTNRLTLLTVLALVFVFPLAAKAADQLFYVGFASRIMIYALAATSLNLILGYAGMVSFGHAAFLGAGAYTVGILMAQGVGSAWLAWPAAMAVSGLLATVIGAMCLRTRGVYFIMITLAFAQMMYFIVVSMGSYGGEDGLNLAARSSVGFGIELRDEVTFYCVSAFILIAALFLLQRLVGARFGHVIEGIRENEPRMEAIGFPTMRFKLACFAIGGSGAGLAGALLANQNGFVSPSLMQWTQSGTLMIMVILGGAGSLLGGVFGAAVYLILEELLSAYTIHWQFGLGAVLLAVVLFAKKGLAGLMTGGAAGPRG
jgi:branched-chain amino acid transport system permease protein